MYLNQDIVLDMLEKIFFCPSQEHEPLSRKFEHNRVPFQMDKHINKYSSRKN